MTPLPTPFSREEPDALEAIRRLAVPESFRGCFVACRDGLQEPSRTEVEEMAGWVYKLKAIQQKQQ